MRALAFIRDGSVHGRRRTRTSERTDLCPIPDGPGPRAPSRSARPDHARDAPGGADNVIIASNVAPLARWPTRTICGS